MKAMDTRVRYTKDVLQKALLKILKAKSIDRVTVKEICEEAKINRGTFYLHYSTPNDLLQEIENDFMEKHFGNFSTYMEKSGQKKNDIAIKDLQVLFQAVLENIELCKIIFGHHGNYRFAERIKRDFKEDIIKTWQNEFPNYKKEHLDYIFDYVFTGSMSLMLNWIDEDTNKPKISVEQLANRLDRLGHYAHLAIQEFI